MQPSSRSGSTETTEDFMAQSRWAEARRIFEAALRLPIDEQTAFIESQSEDPELLAEIRLLLDADSRASRFLESPAVGQADRTEAVGLRSEAELLPTGQRVGRYEISGVLGEGGMGRVYRARRSDGHFDQDVAVKVIRSGLGGDALVACFLRERQILANLDHPGIARLLDGGATTDGRPYLVMELIEGQPLLDYCRRDAPQLEARLGIFLRICDAVDYAHRQLVLHRDLKPDNVLVDTEGRPRLLDFGTAKLLDDAQIEMQTTVDVSVDSSATARHWCSPGYASPEQMAAESVSTATDIYALGGVLYALLTDTGPHRFTHHSPMAMARVVIEKAVEPPSRSAAGSRDPEIQLRSRVLRGDLDTIALKALNKDPQRRYRSAAALADDVRRYLEQRPIRARRPTLGYRTDRFLRRHWRGVGLSALLLVAIFVGAGAYVVQSRETAFERDRATAQQQKAEQVASLLAEMFEDFDPDESPGRRHEIQRRLDRNARRIDAVASDPEVRAALMHTLGVAYGKLGDYRAADEALSQAVRLRRLWLGTDHLDTASSLRRLGAVAAQNGQWARGAKLRGWAAEIRHRLLPENDLRIAESLLDSADGAASMDDPQTAVADAERAVAILERASPGNELRLAEARLDLGSYSMILGRFERAEALMQQALDTQVEQLAADHSAVARTRREMAILAIRRGDLPTARRQLEAARTAYDRVLGEDHPRSVNAAQELGIVYLSLGMCGQARAMIERSLAMGRRLFGDRNANVGILMQYLGILRFYCGPLADAYQPLAEAVAVFEATLGPDHHRTGSALAHLAAAQRRREDFAGAESSLKRAHDIRLAFYGPRNAVHAETLREQGLLARDRGRLDNSQTLLKRALEMRRDLLGASHPETLRSELDLARLLQLQGHPLQAKAQVEEIQRRIVDLHGEGQAHLRYAAWLLSIIEQEISGEG